jgi:hypothetical protein
MRVVYQKWDQNVDTVFKECRRRGRKVLLGGGVGERERNLVPYCGTPRHDKTDAACAACGTNTNEAVQSRDWVVCEKCLLAKVFEWVQSTDLVNEISSTAPGVHPFGK